MTIEAATIPLIRLLLIGFLVISAQPWLALDAAGQAGEDPGPGPLAPADTSSPRATLTSLIDNVDAVYRALEGVLDAYEQGQALPAEDAAPRDTRKETSL